MRTRGGEGGNLLELTSRPGVSNGKRARRSLQRVKVLLHDAGMVEPADAGLLRFSRVVALMGSGFV